MPPPTRKATAFVGLMHPWIFLFVSASCLPGTIWRLFKERRFGVLLNPSSLRDAWFTDFWGRLAGPGIRSDAAERVMALLRGQVSKGAVMEEQVGPLIGGTVLEIGAGSGLWVDVYRQVAEVHAEGENGYEVVEGGVRRRKAGGDGDDNDSEGIVTRIYGVEPNQGQHASLQRAITKAELEDVYQIVPVGIEDLNNPEKWNGKIEKGSVDCVVSILCLCSIPEPEKNIRELYGYLKKGGRWYAYEHVQTEYSWYMKAYQRLLNIFWPHFIGGCLLCRQTEKTLREAGPWEKIDVGQPPDEPWFHCVPHILGTFTK